MGRGRSFLVDCGDSIALGVAIVIKSFELSIKSGDRIFNCEEILLFLTAIGFANETRGICGLRWRAIACVETMDEFAIELDNRQRVMAAIVFSDAVAFSARMSADEGRTLNLVERDLDLMREICQRCHGRVIKSTGDGLLMYFDNAMDAVACALEIQKQLAQAAKTLPEADVLEHRIGIHLGNVYVKDNDVMGNGVNIAARLQTQAEPGGICLSKTVYDTVKNSLSVNATYLGPRELKNISDAFPVYQILLEARSPSQKPGRSSPSLSRQDYRHRQVLLDKVRNYWIKGVLETSLHDRAMLELGLELRDDMLDRPWSVVWQTEETSFPLPSGTKAIEKFDELGAGRTLLILGDPGSGKTTTLLEMARDLIDRAKYDIALAIPVIFNLSSWPGKKQTIAKWLVTELNTKYQVGKDTARTWVKEQKLLLLLDGLDEVSGSIREDCVEAINQFCQEHGETEIVVCSRIRDYEALSHKLQLQGAICLQPLTLEQVRVYFNEAGQELAAIAGAIDTDPTLQELARSPLMLSIMSLAYRDVPASELSAIATLEERRKHLFDAYIQRMFDRRFADNLYDNEKTKSWLSYLAKQLVREGQTVFFIERMQPSWLATAGQKFGYNLRFCCVYGAAIGCVILSLLVSLASWFSNEAVSLHEQVLVVASGIYLGVPLGILGAIIWSILSRFLDKKLFAPIGGFAFSILFGFSIIPIAFLTWMLIITWDYMRWIDGDSGFIEYVINGIIYNFIGVMTESFLFLYPIAVLVGLSFWGLLRSPIVPSNQLQWSIASAKRKFLDGAIWGLGVSIILGFFFLAFQSYRVTIAGLFISGWSFGINLSILGLTNALFLTLLFEIIGGAIGFFVGGLTGTAIETTTTPNQGVWQSVRNTLILGTVSTLVLGTILALLNVPISLAIILGFVIAMLSGGLTAVKHFLLRVVLRSCRLTPWNYARFLDYATSCIFLQKIGGGYIFIHRLLLEHFASMDLQLSLKNKNQ